jgi:DNA-3-methyladenine glycosylase I
VLRKREHYRLAYDNFAAEKVARYNDAKIAALLANPGIIRNRLKVQASLGNARCFLAVQEEFGSFASYLWRFVDGRPIVNRLASMADYQATSPESDAMSRDLRQRGFKFVGSTICYSLMQATGLVNDHSLACFRRSEIVALYPPDF